MKKLWQMIKGCPLFSILIISGVIVTAGGYVGAALGVYKWDVSFHHPMAQTVLLDERVATGTDATSTDAPGKSELTSESTGSAAAEEQTTEVIQNQDVADFGKSARNRDFLPLSTGEIDALFVKFPRHNQLKDKS